MASSGASIQHVHVHLTEEFLRLSAESPAPRCSAVSPLSRTPKTVETIQQRQEFLI